MNSDSELLSRDMSLFDITMIGVGAMIGAGVFVLIGEAAGIAGPALILSFALNGIVTIFTAMVYAELGSAIPEAGGGYLWVKEGLPGSNAFLAGWMSWFAHAVAAALYAIGFGAFIFELLRILNVSLVDVGISLTVGKKVFGVLIALSFAYINFRGASETGLAGNIVTLSTFAVIGVFCFLGLKFMFFPELGFTVDTAEGGMGGMGTEKLTPFIPDETGWMGTLSAMALTFIAFAGYEIIVQVGGEVEEPRRNIPKAVFWSLAIVVPIYMLVAFVLVGASNPQLLITALEQMGEHVPEGLSGDVQNWEVLRHVGELGLARAAAQFVPFGTVLILVGGMLSTMSALNATTFSSTRVSFAMGRDRNLPDQFGAIHPETRTPHIALSWTAALIVYMVVFVPITTVAAAADIMFLLLFLQVNVAAITIRKKYGDKLAYGYLMPFFPIVPIIGIVTKLALALFMFNHYPIAWVYVLIWLGAGLALYRFYAMHRKREKQAPPVVSEEKPPSVRPNSVLIPVADPENARTHIDLGARIARRRDSQLVLLHVVTVPSQLPPSTATDFVNEARPLLAELREYAEQYEVPVSTLMRVGHEPAQAIIHTAQDKNTEYLIMGWKGSIHEEETVIGLNIDHVLKESNTHTVVMQRQSEEEEIEKILVPVAHPETGALALAVANLLLEDQPFGTKTILHVSEERLTYRERRKFKERISKFIKESDRGPEAFVTRDSRFEFDFRVNSDQASVIARVSENYDRLILGTSHQGIRGLFGRRVFGKTPTRLAGESKCPVIFVRPREMGVKFELQYFFQYFRELEEGPGVPEGSE